MPRWRTFSCSVFGKIWVWDISINGKIKIDVDYIQRLWNSPHHYCLYWIEVLLLKISTLHRLVCWCLTHFHVDVDVECTSADVQVSGLLCHKQCFWVDIETLKFCVTSFDWLHTPCFKSSPSLLLCWLSSTWCNCCATDLYSRDKFLLINFLFRSVAAAFPFLSLSSSSLSSLW